MFRDIGRGNDNISSNNFQMSSKVVERSANRKLEYELLLVVYSNFSDTFPRFKLFNAENHILPIPLIFDLEFEGHAVGMWRRNLAPEN